MRTEDMFNRVMSKDNISVACLLESTTTDSRLVVANAHIHWDPQYRDVKIVQVAMLIEEIEKLREQFARFPPKPPKDGDTKRPFSRYQDPSHISAIICGDFNSVPHSAVYNFLSDGTLAADHEDFMIHQYGHYTNRGIYHKMGLKSAYAHIGELPMTNYTPGYEGAIDYIWYTTSTLAVTELLGEVDKQYLSRVVGFPNAHFPSECVFLFCTHSSLSDVSFLQSHPSLRQIHVQAAAKGQFEQLSTLRTPRHHHPHGSSWPPPPFLCYMSRSPSDSDT